MKGFPGLNVQQVSLRRHSAVIVELFLGSCLSAVFALKIVGRVDHAVLLWPVSGVAIALALAEWHSGWKKRVHLCWLPPAAF